MQHLITLRLDARTSGSDVAQQTRRREESDFHLLRHRYWVRCSHRTNIQLANHGYHQVLR